MTTSLSFISYLQSEKIKFWQVISTAVDDGLILIDEETETIIPTLLFMRNYPDLSEVVTMLAGMWIEGKSMEFHRGSSAFA